MKLEINIDPNIKETIIKIFAESMNDDVALVQSILGSSSINRIVGLKDEYLVRLRMYDLEERFRSTTFIRISQGELINLDYVKGLDLSYKGTIALEFITGDVSYVSRRSLKNFKEALGI